LFATGYIWNDLKSAGLVPSFENRIGDGPAPPLETWWPVIKPYWDLVQQTSFCRALQITARDLYGIEKIDDHSIQQLDERVRADNRPGLYQLLLYDRGHIRKVITCQEKLSFPDEPNFCALSTRVGDYFREGTYARLQNALFAETEIQVESAESLALALQVTMRTDLEMGALGFKLAIDEFRTPDFAQAEKDFRRFKELDAPLERFPALRDFVIDRCFDVAAETGVPIAVHTGYWADFRRYDPKFMLDFAQRRPEIRFDLLHLGMPMIRDAILIGKTLNNVTLNLAWSAIISQTQTIRALDEVFDLVPLNKVIAFGGDYQIGVQKVWGHLVMVRECVAAALAKRIDAGRMDLDDALQIARLWFFDNPNRFYSLSLE
jgi:hypothetical protein